MATAANVATPTPNANTTGAGHEYDGAAQGGMDKAIGAPAPDKCDHGRDLLQRWTPEMSLQVGISGPAFMDDALQTLCSARSTDHERRRALSQAEGFVAGAKHPERLRELAAALERISLEMPKQSASPTTTPRAATTVMRAASAHASAPASPVADSARHQRDVRSIPPRGESSLAKPDDLRTAEPFRSLFPQRLGLRDEIALRMAEDGFDPAFPIITWNSTVVDGHTRLSAAQKAGLRTVYHIDHQFTDEGDAIEYAIRCQRNRRNLTADEIVRCVEELGKRTRGRPSGNPQDCGIPEPPTAAQIADTLGVSTRTVEQARTISDHATPEVKAAVADGNLSVNAAYQATQRARGGGRQQKPLPLTPEPDRIARWRHNLRQIAEKFPRHWWRCIAEAMRHVAADLDIEAADSPEEEASP